MAQLNHCYSFISHPNRILKFFRLYEGCCVENVSSPARDEMGSGIVFVCLVRYLLASKNCIGGIMLIDQISALSVECHIGLRNTFVGQCFRRYRDILSMREAVVCSDQEH